MKLMGVRFRSNEKRYFITQRNCWMPSKAWKQTKSALSSLSRGLCETIIWEEARVGRPCPLAQPARPSQPTCPLLSKLGGEEARNGHLGDQMGHAGWPPCAQESRT